MEAFICALPRVEENLHHMWHLL